LVISPAATPASLSRGAASSHAEVGVERVAFAEPRSRRHVAEEKAGVEHLIVE